MRWYTYNLWDKTLRKVGFGYILWPRLWSSYSHQRQPVAWKHCLGSSVSLHLKSTVSSPVLSSSRRLVLVFHIKVFSASSKRSPSLHINTFQVSAASHFLMSRWPKQITWPSPETSRGNELHLFRWEAATYRPVFPFSLPQIVSNK